jgi:hypothetical protein
MRCRLLLLWLLAREATSLTLPSSFLGRPLSHVNYDAAGDDALLVMRKQKASDKRTRARQRGLLQEEAPVLTAPSSRTTSPMQAKGAWQTKKAVVVPTATTATLGGRGRSRKRSAVYTSLSFYHNKFLHLLQAEYEAEVRAHVPVAWSVFPWRASLFHSCRHTRTHPLTHFPIITCRKKRSSGGSRPVWTIP